MIEDLFLKETEAGAQICAAKKCSQKFRKIQRKAAVLEPLFDKARSEACNLFFKKSSIGVSL